MSHSLSSWINHIKSDDIDGGLAADFDGSLSGLGSELGSNPYNMRLLIKYNSGTSKEYLYNTIVR